MVRAGFLVIKFKEYFRSIHSKHQQLSFQGEFKLQQVCPHFIYCSFRKSVLDFQIWAQSLK